MEDFKTRDKFIINQLRDNKEYDYLVTLLDYRIPISTCIKEVYKVGVGRYLVDTLLCAGDTEYRFISVCNDGKGIPNIIINGKSIFYTTVDDKLKEIANEIYKEVPNHTKNSILTKKQMNKLLTK